MQICFKIFCIQFLQDLESLTSIHGQPHAWPLTSLYVFSPVHMQALTSSLSSVTELKGSERWGQFPKVNTEWPFINFRIYFTTRSCPYLWSISGREGPVNYYHWAILVNSFIVQSVTGTVKVLHVTCCFCPDYIVLPKNRWTQVNSRLEHVLNPNRPTHTHVQKRNWKERCKDGVVTESHFSKCLDSFHWKLKDSEKISS